MSRIAPLLLSVLLLGAGLEFKDRFYFNLELQVTANVYADAEGNIHMMFWYNTPEGPVPGRVGLWECIYDNPASKVTAFINTLHPERMAILFKSGQDEYSFYDCCNQMLIGGFVPKLS